MREGVCQVWLGPMVRPKQKARIIFITMPYYPLWFLWVCCLLGTPFFPLWKFGRQCLRSRRVLPATAGHTLNMLKWIVWGGATPRWCTLSFFQGALSPCSGGWYKNGRRCDPTLPPWAFSPMSPSGTSVTHTHLVVRHSTYCAPMSYN